MKMNHNEAFGNIPPAFLKAETRAYRNRERIVSPKQNTHRDEERGKHDMELEHLVSQAIKPNPTILKG
jgi:hypothetical protein